MFSQGGPAVLAALQSSKKQKLHITGIPGAGRCISLSHCTDVQQVNLLLWAFAKEKFGECIDSRAVR